MSRSRSQSFKAPVYHQDQALILTTHKLGESDRIISFLSPREGITRAVAKGARRSKSSFGPYLEPFMHSEVFWNEGKSLGLITQSKNLHPYGLSIVSDYTQFMAASLIAQCVLKLSDNDYESSQDYYDLTLGAFAALASQRFDTELIVMSYMLRALAIAGWSLDLRQCSHCQRPASLIAMDINESRFYCQNCADIFQSVSIDPEVYHLILSLYTSNWPAAITSNTQTRKASLKFINTFVRTILEESTPTNLTAFEKLYGQ